MALIIYNGASGKVRPTWWGRVTYKGQAREKNLGVPIAGTVPVDEKGRIALSMQGDAAFERSRKAAARALETWRREMRRNPAELQESAYKANTGKSLAGVPFGELIEKWTGLKRQRPPTEERTEAARATFKRFGAFARRYAAAHGTRCETLNDITPEIAAAWFDEIKGEFAWATVKDYMYLMSGAYKRWATNGQSNPFSDIQLRGSKEDGEEKKRTERKALTPGQFARLLKCVKENARLYPLVVCAAYTGMRLGDVCKLKVADVDLDKGMIDCVTAKAGVRVRIPILSRELREVLDDCCALPADGEKPSPYVFPWAASQYTRNKTAIVRAVKPYFARAVYGNARQAENAEIVNADADADARPPDLETEAARAGWQESKRARVVEIYRRFKAGERSHSIADALGIARGQVSAYLREAERLTGETLRPRTKKRAKPGTVDLLEKTRAARTVGQRAASIWGWHNLRHNFITCALNNGVPLYKVAAIVGHQTTRMTAGYADTETDTRPTSAALAPARKALTVDEIVSTLTDTQRKELARKLLGL